MGRAVLHGVKKKKTGLTEIMRETEACESDEEVIMVGWGCKGGVNLRFCILASICEMQHICQHGGTSNCLLTCVAVHRASPGPTESPVRPRANTYIYNFLRSEIRFKYRLLVNYYIHSSFCHF